MINSPSFRNWHHRPAAWISVTALLVSFAYFSSSSHAAIHYQDNFNRADSLNSNVIGSATGGTWTLNRDANNSGGPFDTIPNPPLPANTISPDVGILNNQLTINCGGAAPSSGGVVPNNNDMASMYVNFDLDAKNEYSTTFSFTNRNIHIFDPPGSVVPGSQSSGGFFILPRAQGEDLVGNFGWVIRRTSTAPAVSPLGVHFYGGTARTVTTMTVPANIPIPINDAATVLNTATVPNFTVDQPVAVRVDVYGPTGNLARLMINDVVVDQDRDIGANFNNATPDRVMFGYTALGTGQRRLEGQIDNLVVSDLLPPIVLGDTDGDGTVEYLDDFGPIRDNFRKPVTQRNQGDLVSSGFVDFADFREWRAAFMGAGGSLEGLNLSFLSNVPEPSSLLLLVVAAVVGLGGTRRAKTR